MSLEKRNMLAYDADAEPPVCALWFATPRYRDNTDHGGLPLRVSPLQGAFCLALKGRSDNVL
jgi:hypothetical protein